MVKMCGHREVCFKNGEQWGHMGFCMCEHMEEVDKGSVETGPRPVSFCELTGEEVSYYGTLEEYKKLHGLVNIQVGGKYRTYVGNEAYVYATQGENFLYVVKGISSTYVCNMWGENFFSKVSSLCAELSLVETIK